MSGKAPYTQIGPQSLPLHEFMIDQIKLSSERTLIFLLIHSPSFYLLPTCHVLQQWAVHTCPQVAYIPWVEQTRYQWNEQRLWMVLSERQIIKSRTVIGLARARRGCHNFRHTGREGLRERGGNTWPYFPSQTLEHTDTSVYKEAQMTRRQWTCFIWRPNNGGGG